MANWFPTKRSKEYTKASSVIAPTDLTKVIILATYKTEVSATTPKGIGVCNGSLASISKLIIDKLLKTSVVVDLSTKGYVIGNGTKTNPLEVDVFTLLDDYSTVASNSMTVLLDSAFMVGTKAASKINVFDLVLPLKSDNGVISSTRTLHMYLGGRNYAIEPQKFETKAGDRYIYAQLNDGVVTIKGSTVPIYETTLNVLLGIIEPSTNDPATENTRLRTLRTFVSWDGKRLAYGAEKRPRPQGSTILAVNGKWRDFR